MGSFRRDPLIEGLLRPKTMASLALAEWDRLLPRARLAELIRRKSTADGQPLHINTDNLLDIAASVVNARP